MGLVPLTAGTSIFALWLPFAIGLVESPSRGRVEFWLEMAGLVVLYSGLISVAAGVCCVAAHAITVRKDPARRAISQRRLVAVVAIFVLNFVAAGTYILAAVLLITRYVVEVANASSRPVDALVVEGSDVVYFDFGRLATGERRSKGFYIEHDDALRIRIGRDGRQRCAIVDEYITNNLGGRTRVTFNPNDSLTVERPMAGVRRDVWPNDSDCR